MSSLPPDSCHRCKTLGRGCKVLLDGREVLPIPLELHICSVMKCQVWKSIWNRAISICSAVCTALGTRTVQSFLKRLFAHRQESLHGKRVGLVKCHCTGVPGAERVPGMAGQGVTGMVREAAEPGCRAKQCQFLGDRQSFGLRGFCPGKRNSSGRLGCFSSSSCHSWLT